MAAQIGVNEVSVKPKCNEAEAPISGLECNICLESANEPVVTLCGHLYCWPCIYKWLHVQESYNESRRQPRCPICKTKVSFSTLVPLYGCHDSISSKSRAAEGGLDLNIPNRPTFSQHNFQHIMQQSSLSAPQWNHSIDSRQSLESLSSLELNSEALAVLLNPLSCKFGEMVYARIFGTSSDLRMSSNNPRIRQQEIKVEKSLNRLSFFFFCCVLLCLFLF